MSPSPTKTNQKPNKPRRSRLNALLKHDLSVLGERPEGCHLIGLDEVGRGSLIGPVVGGAVCFPRTLSREQKKLLHWLDDSKKLNAQTRAELSAAIHAHCHVGIGVAEKDEVDNLNVHYASLLALHRALQQLCEGLSLTTDCPDLFMLLDGKAVIPDLGKARQRAIIKGDGLSAAIAAASVVAKHYRDSLIRQLAADYPGYGWEENMGYATPAHLRGIQELGITPLHRKNFRQIHAQLNLPLEV